MRHVAHCVAETLFPEAPDELVEGEVFELDDENAAGGVVVCVCLVEEALEDVEGFWGAVEWLGWDVGVV